MPLIKMKLGDHGAILVEVPEGEGIQEVGTIEEAIEKMDKAFDRLVQHEIVENCKVLVSAFERLKKQPLPPRKALAEFGLQFNREGNVYLVKAAANANFKISLEWELY